MKVGPYADLAQRKELRQRRMKVPGLDISPEALAKRPAFDAALIAEEEGQAPVLAALDWWLGATPLRLRPAGVLTSSVAIRALPSGGRGRRVSGAFGVIRAEGV